jgi:DNA-binding transcriptional ArsR family regulator
VPAADVYDAIASPVRREILDLLRDGARPVNELAASFALTRPAISQHLRVLREAGLVTEVRSGRMRIYRLDAGPLRDVAAWTAHYEEFWRARARALSALLEEQGEPAEHDESNGGEHGDRDRG